MRVPTNEQMTILSGYEVGNTQSGWPPTRVIRARAAGVAGPRAHGVQGLPRGEASVNGAQVRIAAVLLDQRGAVQTERGTSTTNRKMASASEN
jgi:hypothetical protein